MILLVLFALAGCAAACSEPPAPYYSISVEMAAAYLLYPQYNRTMTGGDFATIVRDTVNWRVYNEFHEIFDSYGDLEGENWIFYDPSGRPDNTTVCSRFSGYSCYCSKVYMPWAPLIPPTAYITGKRNMFSNTPAYVYSNDTDTHFVQIVADNNCVPGSIRLINRYDLGYDMGGSLTNYYNYAVLTAAQAQSFFLLPPDCQFVSTSDKDTPARSIVPKPYVFF